MKRPIPEKSPEQLAKLRSLRQAVSRSMASSWLDHIVFSTLTEISRVVFGPQRCTVVLNPESYTCFDGREAMLSVLGLSSKGADIFSGGVLRIPEKADSRDSSYFPQLAAAWELMVDDYSVQGNTFLLEIGSGFRTVSIKFIDVSRKYGKATMRLDALVAYHGHDYIDLDISHPDASTSIQRFIRYIGEMAELLIAGCGDAINDKLEALVDEMSHLQTDLCKSDVDFDKGDEECLLKEARRDCHP